MNFKLGGSKKKTSEKGTKKTTGTVTQREQLKLDEEAVQKIIEDVLSGPQGLASIFQGEQSAGIFDSSVAAQAAGDLAANLVGEIAKLTGVREATREEDSLVKTTGTATTRGKSGEIGADIGDLP
jgi:hypothetical protein